MGGKPRARREPADDLEGLLLAEPDVRWLLTVPAIDDGCAAVVAGLDDLDGANIAGLIKMTDARDKLCKALRGLVTRFQANIGCDRDTALDVLGEELAHLDKQRAVSRLHTMLVALDEQAMARGDEPERDRVRGIICDATGMERDTLRVALSSAKKRLGHR